MMYAAGRLAIGLGIAVLPGTLLRGLVGDDASRPSVRYIGRLMGARDALIGAGALGALRAGRPAGPWLAAGAVADGSDVVATVVSWRHLHPRGRALAAALALAGAAAGGRLAAAATHAGPR